MLVETVSPAGASSWALGLVGAQSERFRRVTMSEADVASISILDAEMAFDGDGSLLRLGIQAYSLQRTGKPEQGGGHRADFVQRMAGEKFETVAVDDPREVVRGAHVVACCTNSKVPVLNGPELGAFRIVPSALATACPTSPITLRCGMCSATASF